jgi:hypothetical protein
MITYQVLMGAMNTAKDGNPVLSQAANKLFMPSRNMHGNKLFDVDYHGEHYNALQPQALYIVSSDQISKGDIILCDERNHRSEYPRYSIRTCLGFKNDWIITELNGRWENPDWTYKLIAASLPYTSPKSITLPLIESKFIEGYVTMYNEGRQIISVDGANNVFTPIEQPKPVKESWSRDELDVILNDVMNLGMQLRQNQLSGYDVSGGNEVLEEWKIKHL